MTPQENPYDYNVYSGAQAGSIAFPALMTKVYLWMTLALVMTAMTAYIVMGSEDLLFSIISSKPLFIGILVAEFIVVVATTAAIRSLSFPVAGLLFALYSILNGVTMSVVLFAYTTESVAATFFVTAGTFGAMSLFGFVVKRDLSAVGRFLIMALFGLIIASLVNMFMESGPLATLLNYAGVLIFCGLTAYDTQKMKGILMQCESETDDSAQKIALLCSLNLYLDFVNLFLYLLRFMGKRK